MSPVDELDQALRIPASLLRWMGVDITSADSPLVLRCRMAITIEMVTTVCSFLFLIQQLSDSPRKEQDLTTAKILIEIPTIISCTLSLLKLLVLHHYEGKVADILKRLKRIYVQNHHYTVEDKTIGRCLNRLEIIVKILVIMTLSVFIAFLILPLVSIAYFYFKDGQLRIFYSIAMSYWWWDRDNLLVLPVMYMHTAVAGFVFMASGVGYDTLLYTFCTIVSITFGGIRSRLRAGRSACLRQTIIQHQEIFRLVKEMDAITSKLTLYFYLSSTFIICFTLFSFTVIGRDIVMSYTLLLVMHFSRILVLSYFGEMVTESCAEVGVAVYDTNWYEEDLPYSRCLLIMLIRSQRPCSLTSYKCRAVSLSYFTQVLSNAWSYFALLRTIYSPE